jgi:hypothetical protein
VSCSDLAGPLDWTNQRRIFGQGEMWPNMVVVGRVGLEDPAQVALSQDHDVIQALPTDRADHLSVWPFCQGECGAIG